MIVQSYIFFLKSYSEEEKFLTFAPEKVAPSYRSEVGRLCLNCGSANIRIWDKHSCPKCQGEMEETGDKEFWT